ncbi:MAG: hypothetical protein FJ271_09495 [Planctomycetes bacterium]|nr:hypothetical protein [Planctomycetota bacterium]
MWDLLLLILNVLCLLPKDSGKAKKLDQAMSRRLERSRWLIYGVIGLGVLVLAIAAIVLLLAP